MSISKEKQYITHDGMQKVLKDLDNLKNNVHPQVIKNVQEGRAHGDLKENAEYQTAREAQSYVEGQIRQLEETINGLEVVDTTLIPEDGKVYFGSYVEILDLNSQQKIFVHIVGEAESDFVAGKISATSPLGKSLLHKRIGDSTSFTAPAGVKEYEIIWTGKNKKD